MSDVDELCRRTRVACERRSPHLPWTSQVFNTVTQQKIEDLDDMAPTTETNLAAGEATDGARGARDKLATRDDVMTKSPVPVVEKSTRDWIRKELGRNPTEWNRPPTRASKDDKVATAAGELDGVKKINSATTHVTQSTVDTQSRNSPNSDKSGIRLVSKSSGELTKASPYAVSNNNVSKASMKLSYKGLDNASKGSTKSSYNKSSYNTLAKDSSTNISVDKNRPANPKITKYKPVSTQVLTASTDGAIASQNTIKAIVKEVAYPDVSKAFPPKISTISATDISVAKVGYNTGKASITPVTAVKNSPTVICIEPYEIKRLKMKRNRDLRQNEASKSLDSITISEKKLAIKVNAAEIQSAAIYTPVPERGAEQLENIVSSQQEGKVIHKMTSAKVSSDQTPQQTVETMRSAVELKRIADMFCVETEAQAKQRKMAINARRQNVNIKEKTAAKVAPNMLKGKNKQAKFTDEELGNIAALFCVESEEDAFVRRNAQLLIGKTGDRFKMSSDESIAVYSSIKTMSNHFSKERKGKGNTTLSGISATSPGASNAPAETAVAQHGTSADNLNKVYVAFEGKDIAVKTGDKVGRNPFVKFFRRLMKLGKK